jgi:hypothetical protein
MKRESRVKNRLAVCAKFATACATITLLLFAVASAQVQSSPLTLRSGDGRVGHIFPTISMAPALPPDSGPLIYNNASFHPPVMQASVTTYAIFWVPAKLQNGAATSMTAHYQTVQTNMLRDYEGHGIDNNNTQYYQTTAAGAKQFIQNKGGFGGSYIDTNPFPKSGCTDTATPGNCITDIQLQTELQNVMALKGWTGGLNKMFLVFTSSGEGSCFESGSASCAYTEYCAYHFYINTSPPIIYSNEPFGLTSACQVPGTPSPNADANADTAATAASHELTEAITDPEGDAWFTAHGNEIGDLCAYNYGANTFDSAKANQWWNGHFYELQTEFSNHSLSCVRIGP